MTPTHHIRVADIVLRAGILHVLLHEPHPVPTDLHIAVLFDSGRIDWKLSQTDAAILMSTHPLAGHINPTGHEERIAS